MSLSQSNLKVSHIEDHHLDPQSDRLYDPLRNLLVNPQSALHHEIQSPTSPKRSVNIPGKYSRLTKKQSLNIKKDIMIPVDKELIPTNNIDKIKNKQYRIIDVKQKVLDGAIKSSELQRLLKKPNTQSPQEIVYQVAQQGEGQLAKIANARSNPTLKSQLISADVLSPEAGRLSLDNKNKMTMSLLTEKNSYKSTDKLYQPLRRIIQQPNMPAHNMVKSPKAISSTTLGNRYQRLLFKQTLKIEKQMFIPIDKELIPSQDISKIRSKKFRIVDAHEKSIGRPLTYLQVQELIKYKPNNQIIIYEYDQGNVQKQYLDSSKLSSSKELSKKIKQKEFTQPNMSVFDTLMTPKKAPASSTSDNYLFESNKTTQKKKLNLTKFNSEFDDFQKRVKGQTIDQFNSDAIKKRFATSPDLDLEHTPKSFYQSLGITPSKNYEDKFSFNYDNFVKSDKKQQVLDDIPSLNIPLFQDLQPKIYSQSSPMIRNVQTERYSYGKDLNLFKNDKYNLKSPKNSMYNFTKKQGNNSLTMSKISNHNVCKATDNLYEPLRQALTIPGLITKHQLQSPKASSKSMLNSSRKRFTEYQINHIKEQIFIPIDKQLIPTNHFQKVKNRKWRIMDAVQRVIGAPVSQKNIKNIPSGHKEIIYELEDDLRLATINCPL